MNGDRLGHHIQDLPALANLAEGVHLHKAKKVAGVLAPQPEPASKPSPTEASSDLHINKATSVIGPIDAERIARLVTAAPSKFRSPGITPTIPTAETDTNETITPNVDPRNSHSFGGGRMIRRIFGR